VITRRKINCSLIRGKMISWHGAAVELGMNRVRVIEKQLHDTDRRMEWKLSSTNTLSGSGYSIKARRKGLKDFHYDGKVMKKTEITEGADGAA
jgi:hypothetical protein